MKTTECDDRNDNDMYGHVNKLGMQLPSGLHRQCLAHTMRRRQVSLAEAIPGTCRALPKQLLRTGLVP
ncbi:hypothetical protein VUR80DRAFT_7744 [Thermomyces stellatus]